jgi:DNA-directed RNA polymerase specialized sigma24 family protein
MVKSTAKVVSSKRARQAVVRDPRPQLSLPPLVDDADRNVSRLVKQYRGLVFQRVRPWMRAFGHTVTREELEGAAIVALWKASEYVKPNFPSVALCSTFIKRELKVSMREAGILKGADWHEVNKFQALNVDVGHQPTEQVEASDLAEVAGGLLAKKDYEMLMARFGGTPTEVIAKEHGCLRGYVNLRNHRSIERLRNKWAS